MTADSPVLAVALDGLLPGDALTLVPLAGAGDELRAHVEGLGPWVALGAVYLLAAVSFWVALKLGNVTLVAPIAYLYPALVALIGAVLFHERLSRTRLAAIVCAIAGSALIFGLPSDCCSSV